MEVQENSCRVGVEYYEIDEYERNTHETHEKRKESIGFIHFGRYILLVRKVDESIDWYDERKRNGRPICIYIIMEKRPSEVKELNHRCDGYVSKEHYSESYNPRHYLGPGNECEIIGMLHSFVGFSGKYTR